MYGPCKKKNVSCFTGIPFVAFTDHPPSKIEKLGKFSGECQSRARCFSFLGGRSLCFRDRSYTTSVMVTSARTSSPCFRRHCHSLNCVIFSDKFIVVLPAFRYCCSGLVFFSIWFRATLAPYLPSFGEVP